jgi:hypothetical protein
MRAASSSWSHADNAADEGLGRGSGWSGKARFNCMAALLARHRLDVSAGEGVDDLAQVEQIAESAEAVHCRAVTIGRADAVVTFVPAGPLCGNERAAAVRQAYEQQQNAATPNAADHGQGLGYESVPLADDGHRIRNITVMGSLALLSSNRWTTSSISGSSNGVDGRQAVES